MTTVINTPGNNNGGDSAIGMIIGALVIAAAVVLFIIYGLPAIRNSKAEPDTTIIKVEVPAQNSAQSDTTSGSVSVQ